MVSGGIQVFTTHEEGVNEVDIAQLELMKHTPTCAGTAHFEYGVLV